MSTQLTNGFNRSTPTKNTIQITWMPRCVRTVGSAYELPWWLAWRSGPGLQICRWLAWLSVGVVLLIFRQFSRFSSDSAVPHDAGSFPEAWALAFQGFSICLGALKTLALGWLQDFATCPFLSFMTYLRLCNDLAIGFRVFLSKNHAFVSLDEKVWFLTKKRKKLQPGWMFSKISWKCWNFAKSWKFRDLAEPCKKKHEFF